MTKQPKPVHECTEMEMSIAWRQAVEANADLIVTMLNGERETYHPPYPLNDRQQADMDKYPGMVVGMSAGAIPQWMIDCLPKFPAGA